MHKEILTKEQVMLLPLVKRFRKNFFLVGGTAIALHIGHRRSIDFDLFSLQSFNNYAIRRTVARKATVKNILINKKGELTMDVSGVQMTFFEYPFSMPLTHTLNDVIRMPDLLTLAAMKAHALGQRAKWKDYVDLYFMMKQYHGLQHIVKKAKKIFGREFNERIFRVQLAYFNDIDDREKVVYMKGHAVPDTAVRRALEQWSIET